MICNAALNGRSPLRYPSACIGMPISGEVAQPWRSVSRWKRASTLLRSIASRERESQSPKHTLRFRRHISTVRGFRLGLEPR